MCECVRVSYNKRQDPVTSHMSSNTIDCLLLQGMCQQLISYVQEVYTVKLEQDVTGQHVHLVPTATN